MDNNKEGVEMGGRWGGLGWWRGLGGKGRKHLNDNKKKVMCELTQNDEKELTFGLRIK